MSVSDEFDTHQFDTRYFDTHPFDSPGFGCLREKRSGDDDVRVQGYERRSERPMPGGHPHIVGQRGGIRSN